jgi:hypothetical protein
MSSTYSIEAYSTAWVSDNFEDWIVKDIASGDILFRIERTANSEKGIYCYRPNGQYDMVAKITKGSWGDSCIAWPDYKIIVTPDRWFGGSECTFMHDGLKYSWSRNSKLTTPDNREVASIRWRSNWNGTLTITHGHQRLLDVVLGTAVSVKRYWRRLSARRQNANHGG